MVDDDEALTLVRRLQDPAVWPFPVEAVRCVETHISWVLLTGDFAFKLKKPVDFGFLDFSTLARRDHFAREELRLNRRLAPELYLDLQRITGTPAAPRFDGEGPLLEVAVKMRQFDPEHQLDRELAAGRLTAEDLDAVAAEVARFQQDAPRAEPADAYGTFDAVMAPVRENFRQLRPALRDRPELVERLDALERVSERWGTALRERIGERRAGGFVREGHGDLHLSNLARLPEGIRAFDCIEFDPALRWIDVVSDVAFLFMDLLVRDQDPLAWRFVNGWVQRTGDHRGLVLLPFYALYRTLVRAKVAALQRNQQADGPERRESEARLERHLALGERLATGGQPVLLLMYGVSGSGKSVHAQRLAGLLGAVHLRSDVERKRLFGLAPGARSGAGVGTDLYSAEASELTYRHLAEMAGALLQAGHRVIVDATFLELDRRLAFFELARTQDLPVAIVACEAAPDVLRERVRTRAAAGTDPSEADVEVLASQLEHRQVPESGQGTTVFHLDTAGGDADELDRAVLAWAEDVPGMSTR